MTQRTLDKWPGSPGIHVIAEQLGIPAATLRALAAERDAAVATLATYRMENGCTRGQRTTQWCAEASMLRGAWLRVIQAENTCVATGAPCHAKRCGCKGEQEMLIEEAREALNGGTDNG